MRRSQIAAAIAAFGITVTAGGMYLYGVHRYSGRFMPNTEINGTDVSGKTEKEADQLLQTPLAGVTVKYLDHSVSISPERLKGTESYIVDIHKAYVSQNHLELPVYLFRSSSYHAESDIVYQTSGIEEIVNSLSFIQNSDPPEDAHLQYQSGTFSVVPEKQGTKADTKKMIQRITDEIQKGNFTIDVSDCRESPSVTSDQLSLTEQMRKINANQKIEIDVGGGAVVTLTQEEYADMILYDPDSGEISADTDRIAEYVTSLAKQYDTYGKTRDFVTHDGYTVSVGGSAKDDFGYQMNQEETSKRLASALLDGENSVSVSWIHQGKNRSDQNDIGRTYAEVSISDQHVWYYRDGECVFESDTVTGLPELGGTTPGVFCILYKQSPSVLKGENYSTPVTYWMPFTYTGTGFHDASWRSKFGGTLYLTTGSHGCVNLPPAKAKELYGLIQAGDPVIVY